MSGHTPGPWRVNPYDKTIVFADTDTKIAVAGARVGFNPLTVMREQLANAALIAAAPKLLAACQAAKEWLDRYGAHSPVLFGGEQDLHDELSDALAAAESRQP